MRTYKYICNDKGRYKSSTEEVIKSVWRGCGSWRKVFKMYIEEQLAEDKGCTCARKKVINLSGLAQFSHSVVSDSVTPWTAAGQPSLSITNSQSLLKLMSIESVMSSNHPILCCSLLFLPSIFPSIRAFSSESILHIRWQKY